MKRHGILRFFNHLFSTPWSVHRHFSSASLQNIEQAIKHSECTHSGEIRFVVEAQLSPLEVIRGKQPRARALELFSHLQIWDTAANNGVLIYLLLADRDVEIIADRGIHHHVTNAGWEAICKHMEYMFRKGEFEQGVLYGIESIGEYLQRYFPENGANANELPDRPLIL